MVGRNAWRLLAVPHRTIVVPLLEDAETEHALDLACRLAGERGARVLLLAPLFVEAELPLDAHLDGEESGLRHELGRTRALADSYGIGVQTKIVRARHGQLGAAVAEAADAARATLIVVGAPVRSRDGFRHPFTRDVRSILRDAPCRVLIDSRPRAARVA